MELIRRERDGPLEYFVYRSSANEYSFAVRREGHVIATDVGFRNAAAALSAAKDAIYANNPATMDMTASKTKPEHPETSSYWKPIKHRAPK